MTNFCLIKKESGFEDLSGTRLFPELPLSASTPHPPERVVVCTQATYPYHCLILNIKDLYGTPRTEQSMISSFLLASLRLCEN